MADRETSPITVDELERIVREADPSAFLVLPRVLRRVIKRDRALSFLDGPVTHQSSYVLDGEALRLAARAEELGLPPGAPWPATAVLLAKPEPDELASRPRRVVITEFWRRLFEARVAAEIERRLEIEDPTGTLLQTRIAEIGRAEFAEARAVLRQDGELLPPRSDPETYARFAAVFLGLRRFAPTLLPHAFPAIDDVEACAGVLAQEVDAASLAAATQIAGSSPPRASATLDDGHARLGLDGEDEEPLAESAEPEPGADRGLARRAVVAASKGNLVRAAILWTQVARRAGPALGRRARAAARGELERLSRRLQPALGFDEHEHDRWRRALPPLLDRAARGFWTPEARLLYDLQKACVDHEREVFTVDLVEWIRSIGRRPVRRSLPHLQRVLIAGHLRRASRRLTATRLPRDSRERLARLLHTASERAELALRERFRPVIDATLAQNGFHPANLPERVAYRKLIDELLDKITARGFLAIGDLRDACSRSQLKMSDLSSLGELVRGDRLLRADAALAEALDGVYRRGEIYLRLLQRLSALAFATRGGRLLTRFVALPYGGTFVALKGLEHLLELLGAEVHLDNPFTLLDVGTVALGLINFRAFRRAFLNALRAAGVNLRTLLIDWPARLAQLPIVRRLIASPVFRITWRFLGKPLLLLSPLGMAGWLLGIDWRWDVVSGGIVLATVSLLLNSTAGREAEEIVIDNAGRAWRRLWADFIPGLFRLIMSTFQRFLEAVERLLYAVDEWLRFRAGQPRASLVAKAVLGFVWFFIAYLVRFYVNLLIEPQVNPIKHFPVVTVSHKIILPLSKTLTVWMAAPLMPLGPVVAYFVAGTTVVLLPGIFGFLVWELKENWRLYEANRPKSLGPVLVGDHGETLVHLLRPGLHSGTLPKLFHKLRIAERRALEGGRDARVLKYRESLHHVEEEIRRFIEREFLALLCRSRSFAPSGLRLWSIDLATNRIRITLGTADDPTLALQIAFEEEAGTLCAHLNASGETANRADPRWRALSAALLGLFVQSGVDAVAGPGPNDLLCAALPPLDELAPSGGMPIPFAQVAIPWQRWVDAWEREHERFPPPVSPPSPLAGEGRRAVAG